MGKKIRYGQIILAGLLGMQAETALADADSPDPTTGQTPLFSGILAFETENDWTFQSDDPAGELSDLFNTIELVGGLNITPALSAQMHLTFEPVQDPTGNRTLLDQGLYAEELFVQYQGRQARLFAGKFNPTFGTAWDEAPGVYGVDFAEDYELAERLGLGAEVASGQTPVGILVLTGNIFTLDTSALSDSIITSRGRTNRTDGGAGNTETLDSFSITLDGANIPALPGLGYHVGYRFQQMGFGPADVADEHGFVAGLNGTMEMSAVELEWVGEVVFLDNAEGSRDQLWYYTFGAQVEFSRYNVAASFTGRPRNVFGGPNLDDRLFQVSAGVEIYNGWTLDAGYKTSVEDDVRSHTVGLLLAREFKFDIPRLRN